MTEAEKRLIISVDAVLVKPGRIRIPGESDIAALAELIRRDGQQQPIKVYRSNNAEKPYTLICGARRLEAMRRLGYDQIDATLHLAEDAFRLELFEHLHSVPHTALQSAELVGRFRRQYEIECGKIKRGGDRKSKLHNFTLISEDDEKSSYISTITEIFGCSKRHIYALEKIFALDENIKEALRYPGENHRLKDLTKLARMRHDDKAKVAKGLSLKLGLSDALKQVAEIKKSAKPRNAVHIAEFRKLWRKMNEAERAAALAEIGAAIIPLDISES